MKRNLRIAFSLLLFLFLSFYNWIFSFAGKDSYWFNPSLLNLKYILLLAMIGWILIEVVGLLKKRLLKNFDMSTEDNLRSRKLHTQIDLLEKVVVALIIIVTLGLMVISIESIRDIGIGIFASAGVVGIIVGLSAQKIVGAILAGIQIAITQPFRIDDAVIVENEWGWIEEVNLTYIVVRLWDRRRLVLPSQYFIEKPFQNWTRNTADIIGSVFIYTDYTLSVDVIRSALDDILEQTDLWDKNIKNVQVTDAKQNYMEIRILVSAKNSPTAWDLRVHVREKLIAFIQENYPECLPKSRIQIEQESQH